MMLLLRIHIHHLFSLALDEGDIQILKTYVSAHLQLLELNLGLIF